MSDRSSIRLRALGAVFLALALTQCTWIANARHDDAEEALHIAGDYKPLSRCLRAELALDERDVSYAIDEETHRARIWRPQSEQALGADEFNLLVAQATPEMVSIELRVAGLDYAKRAFLARLAPMVQRCVARENQGQSRFSQVARALPCRRDRARRIRMARLGRHLLPINPLTLL
jgi:hypothetical protein